MDVKIIVCTHKAYKMPDDPMYLPLQVGRAIHGDLGYAGDHTGDNISAKNPNYCELTGLYWAWKNLDADYIGLCHYRRYFGARRAGDKWQRLLTAQQAHTLLEKTPVVLPRQRNYYIETNYTQYIHAHHAQDLDTTRAILEERHPGYLAAYDKVMASTKGHRFNMLLMGREVLEGYCQWLFDVLFELEKRLDISGYSDYDKRVFGFVSERLLDVWLEANHISYTELPVVNMEGQNWLKKGFGFLKRKFIPTETR